MNSIDPKASSDKANESSGDLASPPTQAQPSPQTTENSCKCGYHKTPGWKIVLDWLTFFAVLGAFVAASVYACIAAKQLHFMNQQTDIAGRQLVALDRPWIAANVAIAEPLVFDNRGAVTGVNVTLTNVGHSVAKYTSVWTALVVDGVDNPLDEQERLCGIPKLPINQNSDYGYLIFPNQPPPPIVEYQPTIAVPEKLQKGIQLGISSGWFGRSGRVGLHVVVCVDYLAAIDEPRHHQTRLLRILYGIDPKTNFVTGAFDPHTTYTTLKLKPVMHGDSAE